MNSIRWKLLLISFLVVFLPVYFLNRYAVKSFDNFTSKALEEEMIGNAYMFGEHYKAMVLGFGVTGMQGMHEEFSSVLKNYGPEVQSHLRIVSPEGIVLFDSSTNSTVGIDVSQRIEIDRAMIGRYGADWSLTDDGKYVYYYCALPLKHEGKVVGIAYVVRNTQKITKAIITMVHNQRVAMVIALCFAMLISAVLAQTMTRRLRQLTRVSKEYARGNANLNLEVSGRDEIAELGRAVSHMAAEIESRNRYNRDFMSTVMHELRTPVTAIKGAAEVLEHGAMDKEGVREKFIANIRYEADRLNRMVAELSELTKLDVEILRGHKEKVDYGQYIRKIEERLLPTFDQEHAAFTVSIPDELIMAMIVPGRIEQVISNLLENAFRYTPVSGRVELKVARDDNQNVLTSVRDTGPGIPSACLERVFDRFYTTEPKAVPKDYGSGLGLAIAKSIIENHQGKIWVESSPGKGSCFIFSLPLLAS